jgi:hypothetical protein
VTVIEATKIWRGIAGQQICVRWFDDSHIPNTSRRADCDRRELLGVDLVLRGDLRPRPLRGFPEARVITLGVILLIMGYIAKLALLWTLGGILVVFGVSLLVLGRMGRAVGGRRHYF